MKITLFTANNPRHLALAEGLSAVCDELFVIQECVSLFPGQTNDFYKKTEVMQAYFSHVIAAERKIFGDARFLPRNVRQLAMRSGDISLATMAMLEEALESDYFFVFGASYIKGPLIDALVARQAVNIHMGISPYYRGNSCNFWALHDGNPDLVGATVHMLSKGLDSGPMLYHVRPAPVATDPFEYGMKAVRAAHESLVAHIESGDLLQLPRLAQDRAQEIRYTRNSDFTDDVADAYLNHLLQPQQIAEMLSAAPPRRFERLHLAQD